MLTTTQQEWLETYRRTHAGKLIYDLSQNPGEDGRPRCSLLDGSAPCFTTNSGRLWFSQLIIAWHLQDVFLWCLCSPHA